MDAVNDNMSENELLQAVEEALRDATEAPDGARTVTEIQQETGQTKRRIRAAMADIKAAGRLQAMRVKREAIDGSMRWTTAYQTIEPEDAAA